MSSRSRKRNGSSPPRGSTRGRTEDSPRATDRNRRGARALAGAVIVALAVGIFLWASMVRVGEGERAFRRTLGIQGVKRLEAGRHLAVPALQRVVRIPQGTIRVSKSVKLPGRDGIELEVPFEAEALMDDAALQAFLARSGGADAPGKAIESAATDELTRWAAAISLQSLVLHEGAVDVEARLANRLTGEGFTSVLLRVGRIRGPGETVEAISASALRERTAATKVKVAILGLDGADWEIIEPLIAKGDLPNLARLRARGAWGNMKTMDPALSPLLWTTVATGKPPDEHGILDFLVKDAKTGRVMPITSRSRKVKALWNIFSDAGRSSAFVAWWATWPPEPVQGILVSDRVAYSLFGFGKNDPLPTGLTFPEEYFRDIRPKLIEGSEVPLEDIQRLARVSPAEFDAGEMKSELGRSYRERIPHLRRIVASARSYQAIALDVLRRGQPDLFAIYYQGIDEVCHRFAQFMPPRMNMVTAEEYAKFKDTVFAYYRFQDRLLGEVLQQLSSDTIVLVLSDHGFQNGSGRPQKAPPDIEGQPGLWHRRYGVFIMAGAGIRTGRLDTTSLLDVAPTILYLAGLPVPQDMRGRVIREGIDPAFLARFPATSIPSYEEVGRPLDRTRPENIESGTDLEMIESLRALGYIGGPQAAGAQQAPGGREETASAQHPEAGPAAPNARGEGEALVTAHLNEAGVYLKKKDYTRALAAVQEALRIRPDLVTARLLEVNIEEGLGHFDRAGELARKIIAENPDADRRIYDELRWIYVNGGRVREGIGYFRQLVSRDPRIPEAHAGLGSLLLKGGQAEAGEKELLEALRLDPALPEPLTELYPLYRDSKNLVALEPIVRRGLESNDRSIVHLNWMGLIYQWKKDLPRAEGLFKEAMELDPDHAATLSNLGVLYGRSGRFEEAVAVLSRAVVKDPENVESWVNLGAAQGRLGRSREAIRSLETAREKGVRTTALYNALAIAYLQNHQRDKAVQYLKESLQIDPGQKDASELLKVATQPS